MKNVVSFAHAQVDFALILAPSRNSLHRCPVQPILVCWYIGHPLLYDFVLSKCPSHPNVPWVTMVQCGTVPSVHLNFIIIPQCNIGRYHTIPCVHPVYRCTMVQYGQYWEVPHCNTAISSVHPVPLYHGTVWTVL